jgi:hypothetical protein
MHQHKNKGKIVLEIQKKACNIKINGKLCKNKRKTVLEIQKKACNIKINGKLC